MVYGMSFIIRSRSCMFYGHDYFDERLAWFQDLSSASNDFTTCQRGKWMGNLLSEQDLLEKGQTLLRSSLVSAWMICPASLQSYWLISFRCPPVLLVVLLSSACQAQAAAANAEGQLPRAVTYLCSGTLSTLTHAVYSKSSEQNRSEMNRSLRTRRWSRRLFRDAGLRWSTGELQGAGRNRCSVAL